MTIKECYDLLGGDYAGVLSRMLKEERIAKYVPKFFEDPTYDELLKGFENQDWELAFRASHTMKGLCGNLGFTKLQESSSELCEMLRPLAFNPDAAPQLEIVKADYEAVKNAFANMD